MEEISLSDEIFSPDNYNNAEETVIGIHHSGVELEEGLNISLSRNYCANCKRKIHCYVKVDRITKEAIIHNTCKNSDCACKCKTHFACRVCGYLHPYGHKCTFVEPVRKIDAKAEAAFQKIMDDWRKK